MIPRVSLPESARMDYRGEFEYRDDKGKLVTVSWAALCSSSIDALHGMHRYAQLEHKPHLKPDQYRIKKLGIWYKDEDRTRERRERYEAVEIPAGPNAAVSRKGGKPPEPHPDFPFVDEKLLTESQRLREEASHEPSNPRQ